MAKVYGYTRVSHDNQVTLKQGVSLDDQERRIRAYFELLRDKRPELEFAGVMREPNHRSAFKHKFTRRPGGQKLLMTMQRGDHLIIDKIDRLWRKLQDFCDLMGEFKERGITLHVADMMGSAMDMSSAMGEFTLGLTVLIAQLESAKMSERICATMNERRLRNQILGGRAPVGTCFIGEKKSKQLIWDEDWVRICKLIHRLKYVEQCGSFFHVLERCKLWVNTVYTNPDTIPERFRDLNYVRVQTWGRSWKLYTDNGIDENTDPNTLQSTLGRLIQYRNQNMRIRKKRLSH